MLIPFIEYLLSNFKFISRSEWTSSSFLPANIAINHFIPDFFGHPVLGRERFVTSNYNESSMSYVGLTMLFLAIAGVLWQWKKPALPATRFYALLAFFCAADSFVEAESQLVKLRRDWKAVPIQSVQSSYTWNQSATGQSLTLDDTAKKPAFLVVNQS